jgi:hypothetical protein
MEEKRLGAYSSIGAVVAAAFVYAGYLRRILAIAAGYDAAALAAAGAFLGLAVGAALAAVAGERAAREARATLALSALIFGSGAFVVGAVVGRLPLPAGGVAAWFVFAVYLIAGSAPLGLVGFALGLAFRVYAREPNRVYAAFLGGGAAGALLVAAAFDLFGHLGALALVAVLAAAGAASLYVGVSRAGVVAAAALAAVAVVLTAAAPPLFRPAAARESFLTASGNVLRDATWSADARAELTVPGPGERRAAGKFTALSADLVGRLPDHEWLSVDGRQATPVARSAPSAAILARYAPAFACKIKRPERALVLGADFDARAVATLSGAEVDLFTDGAAREVLVRSGRTTGRAGDGRVSLRRGDGRAFLRGRAESYDLILTSPSLVPAYAALAPTLRTDYLLTVEAFRQYYRSLSAHGTLAVVAREGPRPGYTYKLAATLYEALRREGELKPEDCIVIFRRGDLVIMFAEPGGFGRLEVEGLAGIAAELFEAVYLPGKPPTRADGGKTYAALLTTDVGNKNYGEYHYDVRPARDDRPFPFRLVKWASLELSPRGTGQCFGFGTCAVLIPLGFVFLLVPLHYFRKRSVRTGGKAGFALCFLFLGSAFATLATSLEPKVAFYLGGGAWSGAGARATLLAVAAAGSLLSGVVARRRWLPFVVVAAATLFYLAAYDALFALTGGWTFLVRFYVAVVLVALVGFFLGILAPVALAAAAGREPATLPWVWAAYVFGFVFADVGALMLAATAGFRVTVAAAFVLIVCGWGAFTWAARSQLPPVAAEAE